MGWRIVAQSLALIFRNFADALRVSIGPVLAGIVLGWLVLVLTGATPAMVVYGLATGRFAPPAVIALGLLAMVFLLVSSWVAVAWHRFILLEDYPRLLPQLRFGIVTAYAGRSLLLGALMVVAMLPVMAILGQLVAGSGLGRIPGAATLVTYGLGVLMTFVWLRLAVVLPATAIGRPYSLSDGWNDGGRLSHDILSAAAITIALNMVFTQLLSFLPLGLWSAVAVQAVLSWAMMMVGNSLLTTLYGHLVEGRRLL